MTEIRAPHRQAPGAKWELKLYVAGQTAKSLQAFANLKRICEEHLAGEYQIEVIDLLKNPATGQGRPDPGAADSGAKAAGAGQKNYRRPVQYRAGAGRARPAGTNAEGGRMKRSRAGRRHEGVRGCPGRRTACGALPPAALRQRQHSQIRSGRYRTSGRFAKRGCTAVTTWK